MYSREWDDLYRAHRHMSRWPWTDLVALVSRYARPEEGFRRVLELGCGVGANIPFFVDLGVDYYAIEGSPTAVALIHDRFPRLRNRVVAGDYTLDLPFQGPFDLIVDRSSLTCNRSESISRCLALLDPLLRDGGRFIAVDWFSVRHADYPLGEDAGDGYTRRNMSGGFAGTGDVHFFDREHLLAFFQGYRFLDLQHKTLADSLAGEARETATWNFVAERSR